MAMIEGGHLVARALKAQGVEHLFTLCGGTIESIYDGCLDEGIRIVDVRVDHCATMMADAYARVTGKLGVSAVTRGPGHAASFYGLATAYMAGTPVLAISGYSNLAEIDMDASQEYDLVATAKPVTKWAKLVLQTRRLPEYISTAVRHAYSGHLGPVHLSMPYDVLYDTVEDDTGPVMPAATTVPQSAVLGDPDRIDEALKALSQAHHPIVIAGSGARWPDSGNALLEFLEATHLPLFAKPNDVNVVREPHPLYFGWATQSFASAATELRRADVVLALGCRFDNSLSFGRPPLFAEDARFIVVDTDPATIGFNRPFAIGIVGEVRSVVEAMTAGAPRYNFSPQREWIDRLEQARRGFDAKLAQAAASDATPIHPLRIYKEVRECFGPRATIALDGGDTGFFGYMTFNDYLPPQFLSTGPIGGIGQGMAFILAGKLARPDEPAVLISGDGSIGYGIMEFDTALKQRLPIVAVVASDQAWGIVRHPQIQRYGLERAVATDLREVAYHKIVEVMGGHGEYVEAPADLRPALERAQRAAESGTPALVNVKAQFVSSAAFAPQQ